MSNWKVSKESIQIFTHSNAEKLQIGKVGSYQVVVQAGLYQDGDLVVFAPEKSILSGQLKTEYEAYLAGTNKDRVKEVRLRGAVSAGIIIPPSMWPDGVNEAEVGADISDLFKITKYEPPIPQQLAGKVKPFDMPHVGHHDCEQYAVYVNEFEQGEDVIITEKIHGSQCIMAYNFEQDQKLVSSKGMLKQGLSIEESTDNSYWRGAINDQIFEKIKEVFTAGTIQIFGEIIPIQSGYDYGQSKETIRIFDIRVDGNSIPYNQIPDQFIKSWAPIVYIGPLTLVEKEVVIYSDIESGGTIHKTRIEKFLPDEILKMCEGLELVSGKTKHIREGVVIRPIIDRRAKDNTQLRLKIINPAYAKKSTGEEIN